MYRVDTEITVRWVLAPTDSPLTAADYDIRAIPPTLDGTYTEAGIINYVAPSEFYGGSVQYAFTPLTPGRWKIYLTTGTGATYQIIDEKDFWIFFEAPTSQASTKVFGASSITPIFRGLTAGVGPVELSLFSIATDGSKFVVAGQQIGTGLWGTFHTDDMAFNGWTFYAQTMADNPKNPHIAYGNGVWVMTTYYAGEAWYSTDAITWTAATLPIGDPLRIASYIKYLKNKDVFYIGRGHGWYSDDGGQVWKKRDDLQSFTETAFYSYLESPPGFSGYTLLGMGQERMLYTSDITQNMGAFTQFYDAGLWAGFPAFQLMSTDGVKMVVMSNAWDAADSTDVVTWTARTLTGDTRTTALLFMAYFPSESKWYAVTQDATNPIFESDDAIHWVNTSTSPFEGYPKFHAWLPDSYILDLPNNGWAIVIAGTTPQVIYQV